MSWHEAEGIMTFLLTCDFFSTILRSDMWLNAMDGTQVDQGKSGMVHLLKGLAITMQGEWVMAGQERAW